MLRINSIPLQNYLGEHKVFPVYEEYGRAFYIKTKQLYELIESYKLQYFYFPNKR